MDLNASPEPEEDEVLLPETLSEEDHSHEEILTYNEHVEQESAVQISRRERDERTQRMRRQRPDERQSYEYYPNQQHSGFQGKRQKFNSRLPPGWLDCPPCGQEIGCLIPSKVPLGESFNSDVPPGRRYSFRQVLHQHRVFSRKIGLVIDLTNSSRYYSPDDWKKEGIKYVKIPCRGRDAVPENRDVNAFCYEVSQFLSRHKQPKKYILVHCTHGHNRTGYMIVHYLMRTLPVSVTQAIKIFSDARPPGIYKPEYVDALYNFYHESKPDTFVCPLTPEWKRTSVLDLNGDAIPDDDDDEDGLSTALLNETHDSQMLMTNDDVLGDPIPSEHQLAMQQFCYQSMKLPLGHRGYQFPGSHPVSLSRDNLQLLRQRYYYATWKADGTRYMMLITLDGCYLIDRQFNFRRVQMRFPCRQVNEKGMSERLYHHFTLLDGEMIIDTMPDSQKQERRYLIYDMMVINQRPFYERWKMLEKEIIEPRNFERQHIHHSQNPYYRYDLEPFRVRRKDFWLLSTVTKLLKGFIPKLSHGADGLIFQGWDDPYVPRTHEGLLKWKYPEMNSVDFLFEEDENRQSLSLLSGGKKKVMEEYNNRIVFPDGSEASTFSGKIIECSWNSEEEVWVCMRVRTDKGAPNEFNTYRKVMKSIKDNITEEILLGEINEIIRLPMYADRIQNESKAHQHTSSHRR